MGYNGVRGQIETDYYLGRRVDGLLDAGRSYREVGRICGVGYNAVKRYALRRPVLIPVPPVEKTDLELQLDREFQAFEEEQTRLTYERFHATLKLVEQAKGK